MQVAISPNVYEPAQIYAERRGLSLTKVIEDYLVELVTSAKEQTQQEKINEIEITPRAAWFRRGKPWKASDEEVDKMIHEYLMEKYK